MVIEIVGTSHIAKQSVDFVRKKIEVEKPEIVAVELDKARYQTLFQKKQKLHWSEIGKIGLFGWLFARVGSWIQEKLGKKVGLAPGSDMKSAVLAARKSGSKLFLIDQPIQITVTKLSKDVPLLEKIKLFFYIFFGWLSPSNRELLKKIDLRKVPGKKVIAEMVVDLRKNFPMLFKLLVDDRNKYMARQLAAISKAFPQANVLAVVGAGHEEGLAKELGKLNNKL